MDNMTCDCLEQHTTPDTITAPPFARWAARIVDDGLMILFSIIVLGLMLSGIDGDTVASEPSFPFILLMPFFPWYLSVLLNTVCYRCFGWTLGKWFFAVRIRHQDGSWLTTSEYFKRELRAAVQGEALSILVLWTVAWIVQYNRLRKGLPTTYDKGRDIEIAQVPHSIIRTVFGIIALLAPILAIFSLLVA